MVGGHATIGRLSNNVFWTFQAIRNFFLKSRLTVTRQFLGHANVGRLSSNVFWTFQAIRNFLKKVAERSRDSGWGHATVGRLSNDVIWTFQAIWENFEKSRWTVTRLWSNVTRPSTDCQTTLLDVSSNLGKFEKSRWTVTWPWSEVTATVGRLSNNVFWTFQAIWENFYKKSLNGHATVVGGHATVGRLSNNVFSTFRAIWMFFEKSRWTVTRQWSKVTRPSADCQTTFFGRFKRFGKILKKVAERSRDSGRRSRDRRPTVKQRFLDVSSDWEIFLKKVAERSRDSGWWSRDCRPTVKQRFIDVSSDLGKFWKKSLNGHATVFEVTRLSADCQTTFFGTFQAIWEIFLKKVAERSRDNGWVFTRPSADCQTSFFRRFKPIEKYLKKVAERSRDRGSEVMRLSAGCQTKFFETFQAIRKFLWKKSLNGHATVVGWSRDCRPTVKQRFFDVSSN